MAAASTGLTDEQVEARGVELALQLSATQKWEKYTRWIHARVTHDDMQAHPRQQELLAVANRLTELAGLDLTLVESRLNANADVMQKQGMLDDPVLDELLDRIEPTEGEHEEVEQYVDEQTQAHNERTHRLAAIVQRFQEAEADFQQGMAQADAEYDARIQERARDEAFLEQGMARSRPPAAQVACDTDDDSELNAILNRRPSPAPSAARAQGNPVPRFVKPKPKGR